jgi:subtilisin
MSKTKKYQCKLPPFKRVDCLSIQEVTQKAGWNITAFNLPEAWAMSQGEGVVIGVIDTGCDLEHSDLKENLLEGINFVQRGKPPIDDNGHSTHIIGTLIAANNDIGVVGVAPKAKVRPIKCLDKNGNGNLLDVSEGVRWAADNGCHFISMSLGSPMPVQQVRKAIQYAASKGVVTFVAAGNAGDKKKIFYPANYPETISISAIDQNFHIANFSNISQNLNFLAPGVDILSTVPESWYATLSGSSMATPFACGVAALVLSYKMKNNLNIKLDSNKDYIELFKKYTTPVEGGISSGFGIIDPRKYIESLKTG